MDVLFRIFRTSLREITERVRALVELLLAKVRVPLPLYALWVELYGLGDIGKNITAMIEEAAQDLGCGDVVRGSPAMIYCKDLKPGCIKPRIESPVKQMSVNHGATAMSFVTQSSDVWISEVPLNGSGPIVRRPSPSSKKRLHSPRKVMIAHMPGSKGSGSMETPLYGTTPVYGNTRGSFTHRPETHQTSDDEVAHASGALTSRGERGKGSKGNSKARKPSPTPTPPLFKRPDEKLFQNYAFSWEKKNKAAAK